MQNTSPITLTEKNFFMHPFFDSKNTDKSFGGHNIKILTTDPLYLLKDKFGFIRCAEAHKIIKKRLEVLDKNYDKDCIDEQEELEKEQLKNTLTLLPSSSSSSIQLQTA